MTKTFIKLVNFIIILSILLYLGYYFLQTNNFSKSKKLITSNKDIYYIFTHDRDKFHVKSYFGEYKKGNKIKLYTPNKILLADYSEQISNIKITNGIYNKLDSSVILYQDGILKIEYDIINIPLNKFKHLFARGFYHYISQNKFFILGVGAFIFPENLKSENIQKNVKIKVNSKVNRIASTLSPYMYNGIIHANVKNFLELVILGNENIYYSNNLEYNINILVWSKDKGLADRINNIAFSSLKKSKNFFEDKKFRQTAVFIPTPIFINENLVGGIANNNIITCFINPNINDNKDLYKIINHEGLHSWFGNLINGPVWFREGITDYYVDKINYTRKDLINNYNLKLSKLYSSPLLNLPEIYEMDYLWDISAITQIHYIRGYLLMGQIDSLVNLDIITKSMIKDCRKNQQICNFSADFLLKYAGEIDEYKKLKLNYLINNFNNIKFSPTLLNQANLDFKKTNIKKYNLDIFDIIKNKTLNGLYLNSLDKKYNKNQFYKLLDIKSDNLNNLHFFIENDNNIEEFFPKSINNLILVPYYSKF